FPCPKRVLHRERAICPMVPPAKVLTWLCNELGESGPIIWQHCTRNAGKNVVSENRPGIASELAIDQTERLLESAEDGTYTLCFVSESYPDFSHPQQQSFVLNRFYYLRQASTLGGERLEINWLLHAPLLPPARTNQCPLIEYPSLAALAMQL